MKKALRSRIVATVGVTALLLGGGAWAFAASPGVLNLPTQTPSGVNVSLGADTLSEPFNCWTDGAFALKDMGTGGLVALPPVNSSACEQFQFSGSDVNHLVPTTKMNGLTTGHTDRGRVYDSEGWWPFTLWKDPATGDWYSYMHTEDGSQCNTGNPGVGSDLRTIGVWKSSDQGANWTYQGVALSLDGARNFQPPANDCNSQAGWPKVGGPGDLDVIPGNDGYLYMIYNQFTYINPAGVPAGVATNRGNMAVARSAISDKGAPGTWYKYWNGAFTEPGQGGHETYVLSAANQRQPKNEQHSIVWSTYLNKYVLSFASGEGVYLSYSTNLVDWSKPEFLYQETAKSSTYGDSANFIAYVNLVGAGTGANATSDQIGQTAWMFYVLGNKNYEVHRRLITFDTQTNLAAGVTATADSNFGFGSAQNLVDGDFGTDFISDKRTNTADNTGWIQVDLGSTKAFNRVRLQPAAKWGNGFPTDFSLAGSSGASGPWTTITSKTGFEKPRDGATVTLDFAGQNYRYVRLSWSRLSGNAEPFVPFNFDLAEFEVYNNTAPAPTDPVAPTAVDATYTASTGFSSTQGQSGWTYMYQSPLDPAATYGQWVPMTYNASASQWQKAGTLAAVGSSTVQPDASAAARVWRAPADGVVHITGNVAKQDTSAGNGVRVRVMVNRTTVWPASGWQTIAYNDGTGYNVDTYQHVNAGDRVLFVVDANGDTTADSTAWNPTIAYSTVKSTTSSSSAFSSTQGANGFTYEYFDGTNYTNLTWNASTMRWERPGTGTLVAADYQHPDTNSASVRTWTASATGTLSVAGWIQKGDVTGGDGVRAKVMVNNTQVWPASGWATLSATDAFGFDTSFSTPITSGDKVRFVVDRNGDSSYDTTVWPVDLTVQ